jgi:hypothetical protein
MQQQHMGPVQCGNGFQQTSCQQGQFSGQQQQQPNHYQQQQQEEASAAFRVMSNVLGFTSWASVAVAHCAGAHGLVLTHSQGWKLVYSGALRAVFCYC